MADERLSITVLEIRLEALRHWVRLLPGATIEDTKLLQEVSDLIKAIPEVRDLLVMIHDEPAVWHYEDSEVRERIKKLLDRLPAV